MSHRYQDLYVPTSKFITIRDIIIDVFIIHRTYTLLLAAAGSLYVRLYYIIIAYCSSF